MRLPVLVAGLLLSAVGHANVFERLTGAWQADIAASPEAMRNAAAMRMRWAPAFGGFHRLDYRITFAVEGRPPFEGVAWYRHGDDGAAGFWADSNGDMHALAVTLEDNALVADWGAVGRTRYALHADGTAEVTDWIRRDGKLLQFSKVRYDRAPTVTGIGGLFFKAKDPGATARWYAEHLDIDPVPGDYDTQPWQQEAGPTVFAPFIEGTGYFGAAEQQWMVNLRVTDLDAVVARLRAADVAVEVDPETYPNGRFARLTDPEGNPIQLWEPAG